MPSKASPFSFILAVPVIQNTWPSGSYGLPKPSSGCPNKQWREGFRYQDSENLENINFKSNGSHFSGKVSLHGIRQEFCIHMDTPGAKISWPRGKYCIYRKGKTCPTGLQEGMTLLSHIDLCCFKWWIRPQQVSVVFIVISIQSLNLFSRFMFLGWVRWDDENTNIDFPNSLGGELPDGIYGENTVIYFCCSTSGRISTSISLPYGSPFYLIAYGSHRCQQVQYYKVSFVSSSTFL